MPGVLLHVDEQAPFGGPLWVQVAGQRHPLSPMLARLIHGHNEPPVTG